MIARATDKGLLSPDPAMLKPTALGRRFLNDLQTLFLPETKRPRGVAAARPIRVHPTAVR
jgi:hypothetical protein